MEAIQAILDQLTQGDDLQAERAVKLLAERGAQALPELRQRIQRANAEQRWWLVRAAAEMPHPEARALLTEALQDSDFAVRQCAALGLRTHPDLSALPGLLAALEGEDALMVSLAGDALVRLGSAAVQALISVLQGEKPLARIEAARSLARIADPQAIPALFKALDDDSSLVVHWANEGLERMGVGMAFFRPG